MTSSYPAVSLAAMWAILMAVAFAGSFPFGWLENKMHSQIKKLSRPARPGMTSPSKTAFAAKVP
jgi:hypothetical protein